MRKFDTKVQHLKYKVLREVAREAWAGRLAQTAIDIPKTIVPGKIPTMRCCVYKERAILAERVRIAMGLDNDKPNAAFSPPRTAKPPASIPRVTADVAIKSLFVFLSEYFIILFPFTLFFPNRWYPNQRLLRRYRTTPPTMLNNRQRKERR